MGASGWSCRVPFEGTVERSLMTAQEQVLASGEFIWPWEEVDPKSADAEDAVPRPVSLEALNEAKEIEEFWDEGTHTILDLARIGTADDDGQFACVRPLTTGELLERFGSETPDAADLARLAPGGNPDQLDDLVEENWSGRSVVIFSEGVPAEVFFWGISGD